MPCFVPFNKSLDISFFILRPVNALDDDVIHAMKFLSFQSEGHGCVYSSVMKSIHGNLVVWYGAWIKRSEEEMDILNEMLLSAIEELSDLAVLIQHGFYDAVAGESKDGHRSARFSSGDTVLLCSVVPAADVESALDDAFRGALSTSLRKAEGTTAAVCLRCRGQPLVVMLHVWKSLQACYAWLIMADYLETVQPQVDRFGMEGQFDVFKVVYVSSDDALNFRVSCSQKHRFFSDAFPCTG
ncbi:hypothetical protein HPP92_026077 [Vanilla planifolia]|uniref:DUF7392 domain-containing protein n=1 Tax=Vanilla planifolia TaxID=51239 RepID=A0A835U7W7_VANPL|nr:hypothetical protein HPP92_026077 [Vanilla planifolia]